MVGAPRLCLWSSSPAVWTLARSCHLDILQTACVLPAERMVRLTVAAPLSWEAHVVGQSVPSRDHTSTCRIRSSAVGGVSNISTGSKHDDSCSVALPRPLINGLLLVTAGYVHSGHQASRRGYVSTAWRSSRPCMRLLVAGCSKSFVSPGVVPTRLSQ